MCPLSPPRSLPRRIAAALAPFAALAPLVGVLSCGVTEPRNVPKTLILVSAAADTGVAGEALAHPLVVELMGDRDRPVSGATIHFAATTTGQGSLSASDVRTDASGRATTTVTLGGRVGLQRFTATYEGLTGVELAATVRPAAPHAVVVQGGDAQRDTIGRALPQPFVAVVRDAYGNAVPGAAVAWSVVAGHGQLDSASSRSDSDGVARMGYRVGPRAGTDSVRAEVATPTGVADGFFRAIVIPPTPVTMQVVDGAGQSVSAAALAPVAPAVRLLDGRGNAVADVPVTFVRSSGDTLAATSDSVGLARVARWVVSQRAGPDSLVATVGALRTAIGATVVPGAAARLVVDPLADSVQSGRPFARPLRVAVADSFANRLTTGAATVRVELARGVGALGGTTSLTTAAGVATFADLVVDGGGAHAFRVTAPGLIEAVTPPVTAVVAPTRLAVDSAVAVIDAGASRAVATEVRDSAGVAVRGAQLAWASHDATIARVDTTGSVGGLRAGQTVVAVVSRVAPAMGDSLLAVVAPAGAPLVRSDLATFTLAPDSEVVVTLWLETRAAGHAGSGAVDVRWAPEALAFEGVELPSGGVDPVVNADAQVAGLLRFAFADVAGFEGRVPLVRLRFHTAAASAAAAAGAWALALEVRELSAADAAFTPLGARATGVVQPLVVRR